MNVTSRGIRILAILCLLCSPALLSAQEVLLVSGIVKDDATLKKVQGVTIIVLQNGNQFDAVTTGGGGRYEFELPLGFQYDIRYTKGGFVSKSLRMDTRNIPEEDQYGGFQMNAEMSIFEMVEGFDTSLTDEPVGIASFDEQKNSIEWDFGYTERRQQLIKDELRRLEDLAANMEKMKARFKELIEKGDGKMGVEKYEDALKSYTDALSIFPDDEGAIEKRDAAQAKIDEMEALANLEANYQALIAQADSHMKASEWQNAKDNYQEALNLKSAEKYPKDQIRECDKQIALAGDRATYDSLVSEADDLFKDKDYALAIDKYKAARDIFPDEKYPPKQIKEAQALLDAMLADAAKLEEMQRRYDEFMTLGQRNFKAEDYTLALTNYEDASAIFPEEREPKDKIEEINKILADLEALNAANAADAEADAERERIEREYQALISSGDQKFDGEQLEAAKSDYEAALELKANEKYPKSRIKRIDDLLARANEDLLAEQDRQAEEDARLAADEESRLAAEERERLAEEERERRLEEERQERVRQAEEARQKEEADRLRRERMLSNIDRSREDEVDEYFREAKRKEDLAKTQRINDIKQREQDLYAMKADLSADFREDRQAERDQTSQELADIYREGQYLQEDKVRISKQEKEKQSGFTTLQENESKDARNRKEMELRKEATDLANHLDKSDFRQSKLNKETRDQEKYIEYNTQYRNKGNSLRQGKEYDVEKAKELNNSMEIKGSALQASKVDDTEDAKKQVNRYQKDVKSAADERRAVATENKDIEKEDAATFGEGKEKLTVEAQANIQRTKSRQQDLLADATLDARRRTYDKYKELHDKDKGSPRSDDELLEPADAGDLPEGVSEKSYELGNKIVIERTVKSGNRVDRYKKVVSKSGTYYFKNNVSITEQSWKEETLDVRD